jgi:hypothetical protein
MFALAHTFSAKQRQIVVLGNPVRDAYLDVEQLEFPDQRVRFCVGGADFDLAYQGEPIRFGEKRFAQMHLERLQIAGLRIHNGGGVYHTTTQLARLCRQRRLPIALYALDLATTWPELEADYNELGIQHRSLALERSATNLVLTNGKPDRLILRSPYTPIQLSELQRDHLRKLLPTRLDLLVVNSPTSGDLARTVIQAAEKAGTAQYSVLTPSLSIRERIELLLRRDRASVCNLSEFAQIAQAVGIDCPVHEECASYAEVAQAMAALASTGKTGDLIVTLGARGCIAGERATGLLAHVGLQPRYWQLVQEQILAHPERKNGVGDRFFGSFVLAHALRFGRSRNPTVPAACAAAVGMVSQLAPELTPAPDWCAVRQLPYRFGPRTTARSHLVAPGLNQLRLHWRPRTYPRETPVC